MFEIHVKTLLGSNHFEKTKDLQQAKNKVNEALKDCFSYNVEEEWFYIPAQAIAEIRIYPVDEESNQAEFL